jgi:Holliday junction resolvasome RuvABC DNA-binding subunit
MNTKPIILIHNQKTGKQTQREMNAEELAQWEADKAEQESRQAAQAEQQALKDSANSKLLALGLSPEEIAAITGN